jgi:hypothetical protein
MSDRELGELHEKINELNKAFSKVSGQLEEILPRLATTDSVKLMLARHESNYHAKVPPSLNVKRDGAVATAGGALAAAIYALVQLFIS